MIQWLLRFTLTSAGFHVRLHGNRRGREHKKSSNQSTAEHLSVVQRPEPVQEEFNGAESTVTHPRVEPQAWPISRDKEPIRERKSETNQRAGIRDQSESGDQRPIRGRGSGTSQRVEIKDQSESGDQGPIREQGLEAVDLDQSWRRPGPDLVLAGLTWAVDLAGAGVAKVKVGLVQSPDQLQSSADHHRHWVRARPVLAGLQCVDNTLIRL